VEVNCSVDDAILYKNVYRIFTDLQHCVFLSCKSVTAFGSVLTRRWSPNINYSRHERVPSSQANSIQSGYGTINTPVRIQSSYHYDTRIPFRWQAEQCMPRRYLGTPSAFGSTVSSDHNMVNCVHISTAYQYPSGACHTVILASEQVLPQSYIVIMVKPKAHPQECRVLVPKDPRLKRGSPHLLLQQPYHRIGTRDSKQHVVSATK